MSQIYTQKDLGYPRATTTATFRVEMEDKSLWDVPIQAIADSRDENYRDDKEDTIGGIRSGGLDDAEIHDWAGNNMNWSDVADYAVRPCCNRTFEDLARHMSTKHKDYALPPAEQKQITQAAQ